MTSRDVLLIHDMVLHACTCLGAQAIMFMNPKSMPPEVKLDSNPTFGMSVQSSPMMSSISLMTQDPTFRMSVQSSPTMSSISPMTQDPTFRMFVQSSPMMSSISLMTRSGSAPAQRNRRVEGSGLGQVALQRTRVLPPPCDVAALAYTGFITSVVQESSLELFP
eukprot:632684-Pelagomonas_calceolata.AAC.3